MGVLDEWNAVQLKWLYLEGVFIGGDIREQLPEEARKFDKIDRTYIKVRFRIEIVVLQNVIIN